jgi:hypothetical protein
MWQILSLIAARDIGKIINKKIKIIFIYIISFVFLILSFVFFLASMREVLMNTYTPTVANAIISLILFGLFAVTIGAAVYIRSRKEKSSLLASSALLAMPFAARSVRKGNGKIFLTILGVITVSGIAYMLTRQNNRE